MNLPSFFIKRTLIILLMLTAIGGVAALLPFTSSFSENAVSHSDHIGHAIEVPVKDVTGGKSAPGKIKSYRSTMMPGEISQAPRKDSMGMDMVPVYETEGSVLELTEHALAMAGVETFLVQRLRLSREIRAVGKVEVNETALASIVTRVDGYIERLFVDYTGVEVKPGDHLVEIYSPDLIVAQQEMLIALESSRGSALVESSTRKLLRWGLTKEQVDELVRRRKIHERLTFFSPIKGTVTEKLVVQKNAVKSGDVLYRLANLESVWVYLDIYEYELPWVQYGQMVEITSEAYPAEVFKGLVWFISPLLNEETRTVKVLVNISNAEQKLKPGMFASGVIRAELTADGRVAPAGVAGLWSCPMHPLVLESKSGQCPTCRMALVQIPGKPASPEPEGNHLLLAVPASAVLDSGLRKLVYVEQGKGRFAPVEIVTGPRADGFYPVLSGLSEGDRVAVRGNFLIDSQLQIRGLPSLFYKEGQAAVVGHQHGAASTPQSGGASPLPAPTSPGAEQHRDHAPQPKQRQE